MNEEISKLIDLQAIDSEVDGFDQEIYSKEQEVTNCFPASAGKR